MKMRIGLALLMLPLTVSSPFASEMLEVSLGYSQVIGPVEHMATVIVGDDGVADATLGGGGTIILTGRSIGATNLIVLDEAGRELLSSQLNVVALDRRPTANVRVVRGTLEKKFASSVDYVCGPDAGCVAAKSKVSNSITYLQDGTVIDTTTTEPLEPAETPAAPATPATETPAAPAQVSLNP